MTADVIRKGTLSMVLSSFNDKKSQEPDKENVGGAPTSKTVDEGL